jgi:hypothetical protein
VKIFKGGNNGNTFDCYIDNNDSPLVWLRMDIPSYPISIRFLNNKSFKKGVI